MDNYTVVRTLNMGSFGTVDLVRHRESQEQFAAKRVSLELSKADDVQSEIGVLRKLAGHPLVVQLVDNFHVPALNEHVLVFEYCSMGDLHDRIERHREISPREVKRVMLQLMDVVESCHQKQIFHRDLKPENVFLGTGGSIKLGDWGLATTERFTNDFLSGSEQYMAPECFDPDAKVYDAAKADIWALGVVLLNCLFGRSPFRQATEREPLFRDFASNREALYDIFPNLTSDVFNVLRYSLTLNPDHRSIPRMREALRRVQVWTTDMELQRLERKQQQQQQQQQQHQQQQQQQQQQQHQQQQQQQQLQISSTPQKQQPLSRTPQQQFLSRTPLARTPPPHQPIVHRPFRVPSAAERPLKPHTSSWDRRKMYTPPTSRGSLWSRPPTQPSQLPIHVEAPEEVISDNDSELEEEMFKMELK